MVNIIVESLEYICIGITDPTTTKEKVIIIYII